ncbi:MULTISPECIES: ArsR/SmtB family transcription factor [unclassified Sphingomonas]|uniref:ArsR/SmtB family transcription factor n=1 Tax=unclassified Sphingomonas TaxID=196159 RepID=UPI000A6A2876|nr:MULTISPECIES: metalloregulator ArsR/SmtB family transcription factor [unclassified Sphingomonas]
MAMDESLDLAFAALADPTRRAILARLAKGEATVSELAAPFAVSQPAISKHLKVLERAGFVETATAGQSRPRRLNRAALSLPADWLDRLGADWDAKFDRLDAYLATLNTGDPA